MKTTPMAHQQEGSRRLAECPHYFALAADQGTGKTWMQLADAEAQWLGGAITGLLVVAPKGVHSNWIRREIPKHLSVPYRIGYYLAGMGKRAHAKIDKLMRPDSDHLTVLAVNVDALNNKRGRELIESFLMGHWAMMVIDESSRIKNPQAGRTKHAIRLGQKAVSRRILSGTMITSGPGDLFSQFEFLAPRAGLLGTTSYRAFVAEYTELYPPDHPLVINAARNCRVPPQIPRRDERGRPVWRNLDKLSSIIAPITYRIRKEDCLDLPPKVYKTVNFELTPRQRKRYNEIAEELSFTDVNEDVHSFHALAVLGKLRQITSGFLYLDGEELALAEVKERMAAFDEAIQEIDGPFVVYAYFKPEIKHICDHLRAQGYRVVEYHGGVSDADREAAQDDFQNGAADVFVGHPQACGLGLTLTAAEAVVNYSNSFDLELRIQSEDRCHRIGTKGTVVYIDLVASDTKDEDIAAALQNKAEVAASIMNNVQGV